MQSSLSSVGYAICAVPHCKTKLYDGTQYFDHLCSSHSFTQSKLLETYAFAYFNFDSSLDRGKFAQYCDICIKDVDSSHPSSSFPFSKEMVAHIFAHMGIPKFQCSVCLIWFKSNHESEKHTNETHHGLNHVITTEQYFNDNHVGFRAWLSGTDVLASQLNLSIEKHNFLLSTLNYSDKTREEQNLIKFITLCEPELHSISVFKGMHSKIFRLIGDWTQLGKMIQSSSVADVKICCNEIKHEFAELIMHHRACHSMASLLLNCDNSSWTRLLDILRNTDIRKQMYASCDAATFFRKLMTTDSLENIRFKNLSIVFATSDWIDPDLLSNSYYAVYLYSIAVRPGPAAVGFCKFASTNVVKLSCNQYSHSSIRMLIKTVTSVLVTDANSEYTRFLRSTADAIPLLTESVYGQLVIQCILFYAPSFCCDYIKTFVSPEWIFGKIHSNRYRFDNSSYSMITQTAIVISDSSVSVKLAEQLSDGDYYWILLKSPSGNNIIRRMIEKITDLMMLNQICVKLSKLYDDLSRRFRHDHKILKYSKCCLDLASKQRNIVQNKNGLTTRFRGNNF